MISSTKSWAVFIGVAIVDAVLLVKLLTTQFATSLLLAIIAITTLLIFSFRLEDVTKSNFSRDEQQIALSDISSRLKTTEDNLTEAQAKIESNEDKIDNLLLLSMGSGTYTSLKKIASGDFGKYHKKPNGILDRELRYLRVIGYIEVKDNVIGRIPEHGENLSEYVWTTETGRDFVNLRESVEQRKGE